MREPDPVSTRPATAADAPAIRDIYAPIVLDTVISFEAEPPDAEEIRRRMTAGALRLPWLVAETADGVAGYAYAAPFRSRAAYRWSVETSVYLSESARGRGIGRRLYEQLLAELCTLGYVNAYAGIALPNEASVRLHEAVGFTPVSAFPAAGHKQGRWVDVGWWVRALRQPPGTPAPPRGWEPRS
ncbi:MAG: arsinothricin resistance N-acetyltransferase ArsN1 family B [Micromonosporaceae bacterium]